MANQALADRVLTLRMLREAVSDRVRSAGFAFAIGPDERDGRQVLMLTTEMSAYVLPMTWQLLDALTTRYVLLAGVTPAMLTLWDAGDATPRKRPLDQLRLLVRIDAPADVPLARASIDSRVTPETYDDLFFVARSRPEGWPR